MRELRPHSWGGFLETTSIPWTRSRVVKAVSPRIAVLSVIRVPECLTAAVPGTKAVSPKLAKKAMKTTKAMKSAGTQAVSPKRHSGFDEVKSVDHNLETDEPQY